MPFIQVSNLCKDYKISGRSRGFLGMLLNTVAPRYTIKQAVKDISFSIEQGDMVGFIGPNGARKSTTVKILSGILHPSGGEVTVDGLVPYRNRRQHVKRIGVVFGQKSHLWRDLPPSEIYDMLKYIYKIEKDTTAAQPAPLVGPALFCLAPGRGNTASTIKKPDSCKESARNL